jgi:hypothetical protein
MVPFDLCEIIAVATYNFFQKTEYVDIMLILENYLNFQNKMD